MVADRTPFPFASCFRQMLSLESTPIYKLANTVNHNDLTIFCVYWLRFSRRCQLQTHSPAKFYYGKIQMRLHHECDHINVEGKV